MDSRERHIGTSLGNVTLPGSHPISSSSSTTHQDPTKSTNSRPTRRWRDLPTCLLDRLLFFQGKIKELKEQLFHAEKRLSNSSLRHRQREHWLEFKFRTGERLKALQDEFWELNVPDPEERARQRLAEYLHVQDSIRRERLLPDSERPSVSAKGHTASIARVSSLKARCSCSRHPQGVTQDPKRGIL